MSTYRPEDLTRIGPTTGVVDVLSGGLRNFFGAQNEGKRLDQDFQLNERRLDITENRDAVDIDLRRRAQDHTEKNNAADIDLRRTTQEDVRKNNERDDAREERITQNTINTSINVKARLDEIQPYIVKAQELTNKKLGAEAFVAQQEAWAGLLKLSDDRRLMGGKQIREMIEFEYGGDQEKYLASIPGRFHIEGVLKDFLENDPALLTQAIDTGGQGSTIKVGRIKGEGEPIYTAMIVDAKGGRRPLPDADGQPIQLTGAQAIAQATATTGASEINKNRAVLNGQGAAGYDITAGQTNSGEGPPSDSTIRSISAGAAAGDRGLLDVRTRLGRATAQRISRSNDQGQGNSGSFGGTPEETLQMAVNQIIPEASEGVGRYTDQPFEVFAGSRGTRDEIVFNAHTYAKRAIDTNSKLIARTLGFKDGDGRVIDDPTLWSAEQTTMATQAVLQTARDLSRNRGATWFKGSDELGAEEEVPPPSSTKLGKILRAMKNQ